MEQAFIDKYDTGNTSIERISSGKTAMKELQERALTMSLFEPKRFFRTRNVLNEITKKELPNLIDVITKSEDHSIIVSVEEESPKMEYVNLIEKDCKIIQYSYPLLHGASFLNWIMNEARTLGYSDEKSLQFLADQFDGDSWRAWNELLKLKAGGSASLERIHQDNAFALIDSILFEMNDRHSFISDSVTSKTVCALLVSQARTAVRVRDGYIGGVHSYLKNKLSRRDLSFSEKTLMHADLIHLFTRYGYIREEEGAILIP